MWEYWVLDMRRCIAALFRSWIEEVCKIERISFVHSVLSWNSRKCAGPYLHSRVYKSFEMFRRVKGRKKWQWHTTRGEWIWKSAAGYALRMTGPISWTPTRLCSTLWLTNDCLSTWSFCRILLKTFISFRHFGSNITWIPRFSLCFFYFCSV